MVTTNPINQRNTSPVFPSPGSDEPHGYSPHVFNQPSRPSNKTQQPLLQTFHPTKNEKHHKAAHSVQLTDRDCHNGTPLGVDSREALSKYRRHSDSYEHPDTEAPGPPHCPRCVLLRSTHAQRGAHPEILHQNSHNLHHHYNREKDAAVVNTVIDGKSSHMTPTAHSISSHTQDNKSGRLTGYYDICYHKNHGGSLDREAARSQHHDCSDCEPDSYPHLSTPTPCCCEVMRDSQYCPSQPPQISQISHSPKPSQSSHNLHSPHIPQPPHIPFRRHEKSDPQRHTSRHRHKGGKVIERSRSSGCVGHLDQETSCCSLLCDSHAGTADCHVWTSCQKRSDRHIDGPLAVHNWQPRCKAASPSLLSSSHSHASTLHQAQQPLQRNIPTRPPPLPPSSTPSSETSTSSLPTVAAITTTKSTTKSS